MTERGFAAAHHGVCSARGDDIDPGDFITRAADGWAHVACRPRPDRPSSTCPGCYLTRAANGSCGCHEEDL